MNSNFYELTIFLENDPNRNKIDVIVQTETWHDPSHCVYVIDGYNLYYTTIKRNQNDGILIFVKNNYYIDFFEYDFIETNIFKLSLKILVKPIHISIGI